MIFKVRLPLTGVVEVSVEASGSKEAKTKALEIGRAFVESLDGDDALIEEWRIGIPNRRDIAIEEVPRLCGGALELVGRQAKLVCNKCGAEAPLRNRGSQCKRPVRPRR